jgi:hypothetical protein
MTRLRQLCRCRACPAWRLLGERAACGDHRRDGSNHPIRPPRTPRKAASGTGRDGAIPGVGQVVRRRCAKKYRRVYVTVLDARPGHKRELRPSIKADASHPNTGPKGWSWRAPGTSPCALVVRAAYQLVPNSRVSGQRTSRYEVTPKPFAGQTVPPRRSGNGLPAVTASGFFLGQRAHRLRGKSTPILRYTDGFLYSAPILPSGKSPWGATTLGNVWEWCRIPDRGGGYAGCRNGSGQPQR